MNEDMHFHDGILCKLIDDYFAPVMLYNKELTSDIMRKLHTYPLGGHLAKAKLLEKV